MNINNVKTGNIHLKAIITGATSFIGIALIKELLRKNYSIVAIIRPNSSRRQILKTIPTITVIEAELADVQKEEIVKECMDGKYFFHLGWSSDFSEPRYNIIGQMQNVEYTMQAISLAAKCGVKAFIGIGSQAECGVVKGMISETTPDNPFTAYAKAKCETYRQGKIKCEELGIRFCWPRLLSAYGPYDRQHTLLMSCIQACIDQKEMEFTKCEQIWDYVYITDVAAALLSIAERGEHAVKYSIASGNGQVLGKYIQIISQKFNYPQLMDGIGKKEYVEGQPMYLVGDIRRLTADTGFVPQVDFEQGIEKTINYMKKFDRRKL